MIDITEKILDNLKSESDECEMLNRIILQLIPKPYYSVEENVIHDIHDVIEYDLNGMWDHMNLAMDAKDMSNAYPLFKFMFQVSKIIIDDVHPYRDSGKVDIIEYNVLDSFNFEDAISAYKHHLEQGLPLQMNRYHKSMIVQTFTQLFMCFMPEYREFEIPDGVDYATIKLPYVTFHSSFNSGNNLVRGFNNYPSGFPDSWKQTFTSMIIPNKVVETRSMKTEFSVLGPRFFSALRYKRYKVNSNASITT